MEREELKEKTKVAGLRGVAILEFVKGILAVAVGLGLLHYLHKDVGDAAERLVRHLHLNPDRHLAKVFLHAADGVNDSNLWKMVAGTMAYSTVRFVEAYGLWHERVWAEWFAIVSGCLYLPWEVYEVAIRPNAVHWAILFTNVAIVAYMGYIRWSDQKSHGPKPPAPELALMGQRINHEIHAKPYA